jgi:hypothetical protein
MRIAHGLLMVNSKQLRRVIGESRFETMRPRSQRYLDLLEDLAATPMTRGLSEADIRATEVEMRSEGGHVVQFATDLVAEEREAVHDLLRWSRTFLHF